MADRFPLILNTNANQIQEIASGDTLDLTGNNVSNAGVITATSFSGPVVAGAGVSNITAGIGTYTDLRVGGDTTFSEDFVVTGNARVTGILTVGTSSIILNDSANTIKVGTALTLGHTQGLQFHTQNLHSAGFEVNQINVSGASTIGGNLDANGDLDVDGHTNLDNVNVVGVTTTTGIVVINAGTESTSTTSGALRVAGGVGIVKNLYVGGILDSDGPTHLDYVSISGVTTHSDTVHIIDDKVLMFGSGGDSTIEYDENGTDQLTIAGAVTRFTNTTQSTSKDTGSVIFEGGLGVEKNLSVGGNVSVGGVLTYEDVTNVDSVGIVTAREGIFIPDNKELKIGNTAASSDLRIHSNGTESFVDSYGGNFYIRVTDQAGGVENKLIARPNAQTELYYNDAKKLQTENTGITITGTATATTFSGSGASLTNLNGSNIASGTVPVARIGTGTKRASTFYRGDGTFQTITTDLVGDSSPQLGGDLDVNNNKIKNGHTIYEIVANTRHKFDCNGSTIMNINAGGVDFSVGHNTHSDNVENRHGTHNDIRIYHSGSHSYIKNTTDYTLWIQNNDSQAVNISNNSGGNVSASFNIGGAAQLYHANSKKIETVSDGVSIVNGFLQVYENDSTKDKSQVLKLSSYTNATNEGPFIDFNSVWNGGNYPNWYVARIGGIYETETGGNNQGALVFHTADSNNAGQGLSVVTEKMRLTGAGHLRPSTNNAHDLGTSSYRWRNIYTNDLNLSNEGGANEVDGTWGNYTIQEGESDLYLINKRNGKKYKFNLTEVS